MLGGDEVKVAGGSWCVGGMFGCLVSSEVAWAGVEGVGRVAGGADVHACSG